MSYDPHGSVIRIIDPETLLGLTIFENDSARLIDRAGLQRQLRRLPPEARQGPHPIHLGLEYSFEVELSQAEIDEIRASYPAEATRIAQWPGLVARMRHLWRDATGSDLPPLR